MFSDERTQHQIKTLRGMMRTPEAAAYCGSTASSFTKFRVFGGGPVFIKLGNHRVVYHPDDLDLWLASRRRTSTSDRGPAKSRRLPASI
jgi:hypothetical protein